MSHFVSFVQLSSHVQFLPEQSVSSDSDSVLVGMLCVRREVPVGRPKSLKEWATKYSFVLPSDPQIPQARR